jgi:hypothetical protein
VDVPFFDPGNVVFGAAGKTSAGDVRLLEFIPAMLTVVQGIDFFVIHSDVLQFVVTFRADQLRPHPEVQFRANVPTGIVMDHVRECDPDAVTIRTHLPKIQGEPLALRTQVYTLIELTFQKPVSCKPFQRFEGPGGVRIEQGFGHREAVSQVCLAR